MFKQLSDRLSGTLTSLRGRGRLTEDNIREALREVRLALLEADVALPVVREFIERVRGRAVGREVTSNLKPGQALVKIVNDELVAVLGGENAALALDRKPPLVILLAGLQGAGKTTTAGKLARYLADRHGRKVMLASCDIYRPAAIDQLEYLAGQVDAAFYRADGGAGVVDIAQQSLERARGERADVLILDTAGRLHVDEAMMDEIRAVHEAVTPGEVLFVVDSMTGQDAANTARVFHEVLPLSGVILTKADGDARGGAALSVRTITGAPIKFMGTGEKLDGLEAFHPDRVASRILGMGDVLSLVEEVQHKVDQKQARKMAGKLGKASKRFTLDDLKSQLQQMQKLGGMGGMLEKLPGMDKLPEAARAQVNDKSTGRMIAIIDSMTPKERRYPDIIRGSRKRRIAGGSGTQIQDVNRLLKQHKQMQKMMRKAGSGRLQKMMRNMPGGGGMPF